MEVEEAQLKKESSRIKSGMKKKVYIFLMSWVGDKLCLQKI